MVEEKYFFKTTVSLPYEKAVERIREALAVEGFGILTEIDVKATLKKKLDVDMDPYIILGACNPPLAHRALSGEEHIGLLLPCNVVVRREESGQVVVGFMDPMSVLGLVGRNELAALGSEVKAKLERVRDALR